MDMAQKTVRFDYFETWCKESVIENNTVKEYKIDISSIFERALILEPKETMRPYREEKARVQSVKNNNSNNLYEAQLLRLREVNLPGIANDGGDYKIIKLEEGEYLAEFAAVLYDSSNGVFVMQRNMHAFTPSGVEDYFNAIMKSKNKKIFLKPIFSGTDIDKIIKAPIYRSFDLAIASDKTNQIDKNSTLGSILKNASKFEGNSIRISIGVGRSKKDKSLEQNSVRELIGNSYSLNDLNKLVIKYKDNEDTKTEEVDLLEDRRHDSYTFNLDKKTPLEYDNVIKIIYEKYLKRKNENTIY